MDHTGEVKLGSQKGVILAAQNEPKSKVSLIVYLHAGLEIEFAIPHAIRRESNRESHALGPQRSPCHMAWSQSKFGTTIAKMAKSAVAGDRPG